MKYILILWISLFLSALSGKDVKEYMKWNSIEIEVNLNLGAGSHTVYTCDFTHDYIDINTDYRN